MIESGVSFTNPSNLAGSIVTQNANGEQLERIDITLPEIHSVAVSTSTVGSSSTKVSTSSDDTNVSGSNITQISMVLTLISLLVTMMA